MRRFAACVEQMTGYKPSLYWIATWGYIAPIVMAVRITWSARIKCRRQYSTFQFNLKGIFLSYLFMWEPLKYGEDVEYPFYMHAIGFVMSLASMLWIPGYALYYIISQRGSLRDVSEGARRERPADGPCIGNLLRGLRKGDFFLGLREYEALDSPSQASL